MKRSLHTRLIVLILVAVLAAVSTFVLRKRTDTPRRAATGSASAVTGPGGGYPKRVDYSGQARHVILIGLDTTRCDFLGFYGNPWIRTPNLDRLASESVVFDNLLSACSTTLAAFTTVFTGMYPQSHGVPRNGFILDEENVTLTEILKAASFRCDGFIAASVLDRSYRLSQGFDHYDQEFGVREGGVFRAERTAEEVTDAALAHLDKAGVPENLFLFAHYYDPHMLYSAPPEFAALYDDDGLTTVTRTLSVCTLGAPSDESAGCVRDYAAEISYMDHHIGRLLDGLDEAGVLDEALIIVVSDHGEYMASNYCSHGFTTRGQETRAAGMVRFPRVAGISGTGIRSSRLIGTIDLLPSLLEWLGLPFPSGMDGERFDLRDPDSDAGDRVRYSQATRPEDEEPDDPAVWLNAYKEQCVIAGSWKFTAIPYRGEIRLHDLRNDPCELVNLLDDPTTETLRRAGSLSGFLSTWMYGEFLPRGSRAERTKDQTLLEGLEALGYL